MPVTTELKDLIYLLIYNLLLVNIPCTNICRNSNKCSNNKGHFNTPCTDHSGALEHYSFIIPGFKEFQEASSCPPLEELTPTPTLHNGQGCWSHGMNTAHLCGAWIPKIQFARKQWRYLLSLKLLWSLCPAIHRMVFSHVCYILVLSMKVQRTEHFLFHKSGTWMHWCFY